MVYYLIEQYKKIHNLIEANVQPKGQAFKRQVTSMAQGVDPICGKKHKYFGTDSSTLQSKSLLLYKNRCL